MHYFSSNKKSLEPLLSNVYSTMQYENATSHKSTSKKRQAGYLHCLTNNLTAADIQPLKHPATHPPHRTSKLGKFFLLIAPYSIYVRVLFQLLFFMSYFNEWNHDLKGFNWAPISPFLLLLL